MYAAVVKALDPGRAKSILDFMAPATPRHVVAISIAVVAGSEAAIAAWLLTGPTHRRKPIAAIAFLIGLSLFLFFARTAGFAGDCGCATPFDVLFQPGSELPRNGVLVILGLVAAFERPEQLIGSSA
jgi:hypothetical protein